jgi:hypothetical protein
LGEGAVGWNTRKNVAPSFDVGGERGHQGATVGGDLRAWAPPWSLPFNHPFNRQKPWAETKIADKRHCLIRLVVSRTQRLSPMFSSWGFCQKDLKAFADAFVMRFLPEVPKGFRRCFRLPIPSRTVAKARAKGSHGYRLQAVDSVTGRRWGPFGRWIANRYEQSGDLQVFIVPRPPSRK